MSRQQRLNEKAQLLRDIQQQRLNLSSSKNQWLDSTAHYDRYWRNLMQWRKFWVVGSGFIALYGVRHPSRLIRWGKRAAGIWGTVRLFRKTFSQR